MTSHSDKLAAGKIIMSASDFQAKFGKKKPSKKPGKVGTTDTKGDSFTKIIQSQLGVQCVKEYKFCPERRWRFDYCIPEHKIALEVEGGIWTKGRHINPVGFIGDMEKYNTASLMGYRLFRTTPEDLYTTKILDILKQAIYGDKK